MNAPPVSKPPKSAFISEAILERRARNGARWYVVQTISRQEGRAEVQLRQQEFDTFFPRVQRTVRHARQLRTVLSAAFPGYLFVNLALGRDRWHSINGTFGVSRLIMHGDGPTPVPEGVVETLMSYIDERGVARFDRDLIPGQAVRVKAGPFANVLGELVRLDGAGRVRVLLDIMNSKVPATIERSALEAV